jgi:predicted Zn-dependent protease
MTWRLRSAVAAALIAAAAACATNPVTGRREFTLMSEAQEIAIGQQADVEVRREMGLYDDRALQEYTSSIGLRLAQNSERPQLPWHFAVVDMPAINAFALPGGYIYLTRGILPFLDDEAQLVGVLGHEIGHVTARHAAQQYSRATGATLGLLLGSIFVPAVRPFGQLAETSLGLLFLKYGRDDELQADALGTRYAARSGWDPAGVAGMLSTLDRLESATDEKGVPNWLMSHPAPADRVAQVQAAIKEARALVATPAQVDRDDYLRRIDGLIYGDNPDQGVVRGSLFLHAALRFSLEFPQGWDVNNMPTQVVAKRPDADVYLLLQLVQKPVGRSIEQIALNSMESAGLQLVDGDRTTIDGLDAFLGTYQGSMQGLGRVGVRAAHLLYDKNVYLVAGLAPAPIFNQAAGQMTTSIRSFRRLSAAEAERIRPNRIDLYTARQGDTWQSIAERTGNLIKPTTLAIMNGYETSVQPRAGERLKVVVEG